jgi:hypothetical protein
MMSKFNEASPDAAIKIFQKNNPALFVNASHLQNSTSSNTAGAPPIQAPRRTDFRHHQEQRPTSTT